MLHTHRTHDDDVLFLKEKKMNCHLYLILQCIFYIEKNTI